MTSVSRYSADGPAVANAAEATAPPCGYAARAAFRRIAGKIATACGSPWAFGFATLVVIVWAAVGPFVGYSATWQLVINTGTTIATFLMLFVLQNSQNRDTKAMNIKLDELLRAIEGARTGLASAGEMSDEELEELESEFRRLARKARQSAAMESSCNVGPAPASRSTVPEPDLGPG